MGATTIEVKASHVVMTSHPDEVADLILSAIATLLTATPGEIPGRSQRFTRVPGDMVRWRRCTTPARSGS